MTPDLNTFLDEVLNGLNTYYVEAARPYSPLDKGKRQKGLKPSEAKDRLAARFEEEKMAFYLRGRVDEAKVGERAMKSWPWPLSS